MKQMYIVLDDFWF